MAARSRAGLALALSLIVAACGGAGDEPVVPASIVATYDLSLIGTTSLPIWLSATVVNPPVPGTGGSYTCTDSLTASALALKSNGTFAETDMVRTVCDDGRAPTSAVHTYDGTLTATATTVELAFPLGNSFNLTSASGTVSETELVLDQRVKLMGAIKNVDLTKVHYLRRAP